MAKRQVQPIRAVSYIPLAPDGSVLACLDDMTDEQREYVGTKLRLKVLNTQFAGKYEFDAELPQPEDIFPQ